MERVYRTDDRPIDRNWIDQSDWFETYRVPFCHFLINSCKPLRIYRREEWWKMWLYTWATIWTLLHIIILTILFTFIRITLSYLINHTSFFFFPPFFPFFFFDIIFATIFLDILPLAIFCILVAAVSNTLMPGREHAYDKTSQTEKKWGMRIMYDYILGQHSERRNIEE